jgi:hypothetical protein
MAAMGLCFVTNRPMESYPLISMSDGEILAPTLGERGAFRQWYAEPFYGPNSRRNANWPLRLSAELAGTGGSPRVGRCGRVGSGEPHRTGSQF